VLSVNYIYDRYIVHYKVIEHKDAFEAICIEFPHIKCIADTREEALERIQELVFRCLLGIGFQFSIARAVW
jgi:hypothetical protein